MQNIRVRYAPSPTGQLHIGGARTALFNYLFAKKNNGKFIIRIEDTDTERNIISGEESQLQNLEWLGIVPDESPMNPNASYGPYRQTERLNTYKQYANKLLEKGNAYYCYCTSKELIFEREKQIDMKQPPRYSGKCLTITQEEINFKNNQPSIRIKVPKEQEFKWTDIVRGEISIFGKEVGDWIIVKNNGIPTYNFAVVIDDYLMKISHVLRGEEHISNTPKQIYLYELFDWKPPLFGHMTLIVNHEDKKLSKRDESIVQFIKQYKELGYISDAIFNFLTLLGWSPKGEKEIFTHDEICKMFDLNRLSKSPSTFDIGKLEWINSVYMKNLSFEKYLELVKPFVKKTFPNLDLSDERNLQIIKLYKREIKIASEIVTKINLFFVDTYQTEKDALKFLEDNECSGVILEFKKQIINSKWTINNISEAIKRTKDATGLQGKMLFMPIRIASTGMMCGPDLKETLLLLGKEKVISRIK